MTQDTTPLREAVASWLASFDILADSHRAGPYGYLRDGLAVLVPIADASGPDPLREAVLALAEVYDDLCILAAANLELSQDTRSAAVERVVARFNALVSLVEEE